MEPFSKRIQPLWLLALVALFFSCSASEQSGLEPVGELPVIGPILVPQEIDNLETAIGAAEPGDTILLAPGTYATDVAIDKPLIIDSQGGGEVVIRGNVPPTIQILGAASGSILRNLTLEGGGIVLSIGGDGQSTSGVLLEDLTIRSTTLGDEGLCLRTDFSNDLVMRRCRLESELVGIQVGAIGTNPGMLLEEVSILLRGVVAQGGVALRDAPQFRARNVSVSTEQQQTTVIMSGIVAGGQGTRPGMVIENCNISLPPGDTVGIRLLNTPGAVVRNCTVTSGFVGILIGDPSDNFVPVAGALVENCRVTINDLTNLAGILFNTVTDAVARGNRVNTAFNGILMVRYNGLLLEENELEQCVSGMTCRQPLDSGDSSQRMARNVTFNCQQAATFEGVGNLPVLVANNAFFSQLRAVVTEGTLVAVFNNVIVLSESAVVNTGIEPVLVRNNVISSASVATFQGDVVGDYNNIFLNADNQPPLGPNGLASTNFLNNDLTPMSGSPQIDGGDPDPIFNDNIPPGLGSERNDIGALGGPFGGEIPMELLQSGLEALGSN